MRLRNSILMAAAVSLTHFGAVTSQAVTLLSTDFNGRTLSTTSVANDTATNLNWTTNGLADPGNMQARNAAANGQAIFNGNATMQNIFAPGLNVGNGNTFWTTDVAMTVLPGNAVTLTDVVFDYMAISASQVLNVNRRSDFTVELFDPSSVSLGAVTLADVISGTSAVPQIPTLTFTFASPIDLTDAGTYMLRIKGGDFVAPDETGNHAGIDNLSINGRVLATIPEPATLVLGLFGAAALLQRRQVRQIV